MTSIYNLMRSAVDYAGLFPPAGLPMQEVVANYSKYLQSDERAMLGRLIVPAMKLAEFEPIALEISENQESAPWRISALVPPIEQLADSLNGQKFEEATEAIRDFNERHISTGRFLVDAIEVKTTTSKVVQATCEGIPDGISAFLEVPDLSAPERLIESIAKVAGETCFAKIRSGGVTPDLIPTPGDVARFIAACAKHNVGFKATAGLHHPMRAQYRLTYADDAPSADLFGFLNVFVAAMIAFEHGVTEEVLVEILSNEDPAKFVFEDTNLAWDDLEVSSQRIADLRNRGIISFGSCSFDEPTTELQQLPNVSHASVFSG